jgi:hypothetical protein
MNKVASDISEWSGYLTINVIANSRPNIPINLFGPSSGYIGIAHRYVTLASDPDNDEVQYTFDWGDGTLSTTDLVIRARLKAHRMHGAKREHTRLKVMQSIAKVHPRCGLSR